MARNYKLEYENYQGTEEAKRQRALRNKARRKLTREGRVKKGDGKDVDHVTPLSKGGSSASGNLRVRSASSNRSYPRTKTGAMK